MNVRRFMLALAAAAVAGSASTDARAQEFTLPPAPSSPTEQGGTAFLPENGPCFYNPYKWSARGLLNQSSIRGEVQDLASGWGSTTSLPGCLDHYGLTTFDFLGGWSYMIADGVPVPPKSPPRAQVEAVWAASLQAAEEGRTTITRHEPVPTIGDGHGADRLEGRFLQIQVREGSGAQPATYLGIPIIERGKFWERNQSPDGRRTWRVLDLHPEAYSDRQSQFRNRRSTASQPFSSIAADRSIQRQERSSSRSSGAATSSDGASSSSSSGKVSRAPRGGKKNQ
jgi:hypothetical protein